MKTCNLCQKKLPNSNFYRYRRKYKDGFRTYLSYRCYDCHAKANLAYYHATKPPLKVYDEAYRAKRKKEIRRYIRLYMRKYRKKLTEPWSRKYSEKLRSGVGISPSRRWVENWNKKDKENNDRIMARYS